MAFDFLFLSNQQFFIPFLFVLAIVFGILELSNVFKGNRAVVVIISIVIAFFAATNSQFTGMLFQILPSITVFFVIMFFIAFLMEIIGLGKSGSLRKEGAETRVMVLGLVLVVFIAIGADSMSEIPFISFIGESNLLIITGLVLLFMIFFTAYKVGIGKKS